MDSEIIEDDQAVNVVTVLNTSPVVAVITNLNSIAVVTDTDVIDVDAEMVTITVDLTSESDTIPIVDTIPTSESIAIPVLLPKTPDFNSGSKITKKYKKKQSKKAKQAVTAISDPPALPQTKPRAETAADRTIAVGIICCYKSHLCSSLI